MAYRPQIGCLASYNVNCVYHSAAIRDPFSEITAVHAVAKVNTVDTMYDPI